MNIFVFCNCTVKLNVKYSNKPELEGVVLFGQKHFIAPTASSTPPLCKEQLSLCILHEQSNSISVG